MSTDQSPLTRPSGGGTPGKRSGPGWMAVLAGLAFGALLTAVVMTSWQETGGEVSAPLPTSSTKEFQQPGMEAFRIKPGDAPQGPDVRTEIVTVREEDTREIDRLNTIVSNLEAKIAEMEANPQVKVITDDKALLALQDDLNGIRATLAEKNQAIANLQRDKLRLAAQIDDDALARRQYEEQLAREAEERARAEELRRQAEARKKAAAALEAEKVSSGIVGFRRGRVETGDERRHNGDETFVRAGLTRSQVTRSEVIANPSYTITQGTLVEATLQTGINSDQQGNVVAVVSFDVWSFDMERVLIPRGAQVFGRYSSDVGVGQKRVLVAWDRIITPDGQSVSISAYGSDRLGRSGLTGHVDNHFLERFGSAALISVIGAAPDVLADRSEDETTSQTLAAVGSDFTNVTGSVIAEHLARPPTITIEHGDVVTIIVNTDLEML